MVSSVEDDFNFEPFESQTKHNRGLSTEVPSLLSANQLLELVRGPFLDRFPPALLCSLQCVWFLCRSHIIWHNTLIVGFGHI